MSRPSTAGTRGRRGDLVIHSNSLSVSMRYTVCQTHESKVLIVLQLQPQCVQIKLKPARSHKTYAAVLHFWKEEIQEMC